ncbi:hypothetical protein K438DRAFT_2011227 [Mycena galopus ATCC 62051]|nr:hypothetical protein K438DRAFT_2011227 [Mycena galopus ATCC 62051]
MVDTLDDNTLAVAAAAIARAVPGSILTLPLHQQTSTARQPTKHAPVHRRKFVHVVLEPSGCLVSSAASQTVCTRCTISTISREALLGDEPHDAVVRALLLAERHRDVDDLQRADGGRGRTREGKINIVWNNWQSQPSTSSATSVSNPQPLLALRPSAAASWIRRALAISLRTHKAYSVNLLVGGYDTASYDPRLYWIDYFGTITEVRTRLRRVLSPEFTGPVRAACSLLLLCFISWRASCGYRDPEAPLEEGLATLRRCIDEVTKRLVIDPGKYKVKFVDKDGVREVEL